MMNLRTFALFSFCVCSTWALAQTSVDTYWVAFTDKDDTPYTLEQPEQFLSQRAIQRRTDQTIPYDALDLPVDPVYIQTVLDQGDVHLVNRSKWFNGITIRTTDNGALDAIQQLPFVLVVRGTRSDARGDGTRSKFDPPCPADDRDGEAADYGTSFRQIEMLRGHQLHAQGAKGQGMLIGVLDSGFDGVDSALAFAPLRDRGGILLTRDMVTHDGDVYQDHWHGRSVLSCMAGYLEGQLLGTAPEADFVLLRTEEVNSEFPVEEDHWVAGAELADSLGCDVLNTSLGYTTFDDSTMDHTYADLDGQTLRISIAAGIAARKGMIPVQSAGNNGQSDWRYISAPADAIDILTVGAVGDVENHAPFSSFGPSADGRVKPDVCAMGWGSIILRSDTDSITAANGTSFSSPILAGLVACLWQLHPERNATDIMEAVRRSASFFLNPNDSMGYGVPNFGAADVWLTLTGVEEVQELGTLLVHPVPFTSTINVVLPDELMGNAHVVLFDVNGRVLRFQRITGAAGSTYTLNDLDPLPSGVYVLKLVHGDRVAQQRIVKH